MFKKMFKVLAILLVVILTLIGLLFVALLGTGLYVQNQIEDKCDQDAACIVQETEKYN